MQTARIKLPFQVGLAMGMVGVICLVCYPFSASIGYRAVALILLLSVSIQAMFFRIEAVLCGAILSALTWNYFFIPPLFTFHIGHTEDILLFAMYFVVALVNGVFTLSIRNQESRVLQKEGRENTIRLYNTILNSLSHELRTPIATIIGATDNLRQDDNRLSSPQKAALLSEISTAALRLNEQVENLLHMSRLESGVIKPRLDWCDVPELVHRVVNRFSDMEPPTVMEVNAEPELPLCKVDMGLLEQVLHNLLQNAALHIPANGITKVGLSYRHQNLVIVVEDNGPGFPPSEMARVFDKFYRLEQSRSGGTGLGLSIAKGFVEAHGGRIILENSNTGGARFTIQIPAEVSFLNQQKHE